MRTKSRKLIDHRTVTQDVTINLDKTDAGNQTSLLVRQILSLNKPQDLFEKNNALDQRFWTRAFVDTLRYTPKSRRQVRSGSHGCLSQNSVHASVVLQVETKTWEPTSATQVSSWQSFSSFRRNSPLKRDAPRIATPPNRCLHRSEWFGSHSAGMLSLNA